MFRYCFVIVFPLIVASCSTSTTNLNQVTFPDGSKYEIKPIYKKNERTADFSQLTGFLGDKKVLLYIYPKKRFMHLYAVSLFPKKYMIIFIDDEYKISQVESLQTTVQSTSTEGITSEQEVSYAVIANYNDKLFEFCDKNKGKSLDIGQFLKSIIPEEMPQVQIGDLLFDVEIAKEPQYTSRGLMHRPRMSKGEGMLFILEEKVQTFWMGNTLIPLTIVFFRSDGVIDSIQDMKVYQDPSNDKKYKIYTSYDICTYALEVNQGAVLQQYQTNEVTLKID